MHSRKNIVLGGLFILTGLLFFAVNTGVIDSNDIFSGYWAFLFVIVPGLVIHLAYFYNVVPAGMLVPGGIILATGVVLQVSTLFGIWDVTWPGYIMSVAVGLFELYIFGSRKKGLLVPVFILGGISLIFFSFTIGGLFDSVFKSYISAFALVALGLFLIFKDSLKKKKI